MIASAMSWRANDFMLLDGRRITTLEGPKAEQNARFILAPLKYFDILEQKMYFVDWLSVKTTSITFADISKYVESKLIPNRMAKGGCLQSLHDLNVKMSEFEAKSNGDKQPKYQFNEERISNLKEYASTVLISCAPYDVVDNGFHDGDIYVFRINPFHPYFSSLDPAEISIGTPTIDDDQQHQTLPLYWQCKAQEFEEKGMYWYFDFVSFMRALARMIDFEITMRPRSEWQRQHESSETKSAKKDTPFKHKWTTDKTTTLGMVRKRLGSYYGIKPEYIEVWYYQEKVSYERVKWNTTISNLTQDCQNWERFATFYFDIVAYNVKDREHSLEDQALFRLAIQLPLYHGVYSEYRNIEVIHNKHWTAKELIKSIVDQRIGEPVLLSLFFGHIAEYIRKYETRESRHIVMSDKLNHSAYDIGLEILRNLDSSRFMITENYTSTRTQKYHMADAFELPSRWTQFEFLDLYVQFLPLHDPLLNALNQEDNPSTFALWVYFYDNEDETDLAGWITKVVMKEGQSFKDMILRDILQYLALEEQCFDQDEEVIFKAITDSHRFQLRRSDGLKVTLTNEHLIRKRDLSDSLVNDLCVI